MDLKTLVPTRWNDPERREMQTTVAEIWNVTKEQYNTDTDHVRSTELKDIVTDQGPALYYEKHIAKSIPREETDDLVIGNCLHDLLLLGEQNWFVPKSRRDKRIQAYQDELEENEGKYPILKSQEEKVWGMFESVKKNPQAWDAINQDSYKEQPLRWEDDGLLCKAMTDIIMFDGAIWDLKTTRHSNEAGFRKQIEKLMYHFSAAFYQRGVKAVFDIPSHGLSADPHLLPAFHHIWVCKEPPHWCYVRQLSRHQISEGHRLVFQALQTLKECRESGEWPDLLAEQNGTTIEPSDYWLSEHGWRG